MRTQCGIGETFIRRTAETIEIPHLPEASGPRIQPEEHSPEKVQQEPVGLHILDVPGPSKQSGESTSQDALQGPVNPNLPGESGQRILPEEPQPQGAWQGQRETCLPEAPQEGILPEELPCEEELGEQPERHVSKQSLQSSRPEGREGRFEETQQIESEDPVRGQLLRGPEDEQKQPVVPVEEEQQGRDTEERQIPRRVHFCEEESEFEELRRRRQEARLLDRQGLSEVERQRQREADLPAAERQSGETVLRQREIYACEEEVGFIELRKRGREARLLRDKRRAEEERQKKRRTDLRNERRRAEAEQQRQLEARLLEERRQREARLLEKWRQREAEWQRQREARLLKWRQPEAQRQRRREERLFEEYIQFEVEQERQLLVRSRKQQQRERNEARWRRWSGYWQKLKKFLKDPVTPLRKLLISFLKHFAVALWICAPGIFWFLIHKPTIQKVGALCSLIDDPTPKSQALKALTPKNNDLRGLFAETKALLELLRDTLSNDTGNRNALVDTSLVGVVAISILVKIYSGVAGLKTIRPEKKESSPVGTLCVVCYYEVSDTLLKPCNHLALCGSCCDEMGMRGTKWETRNRVKCPICRGRVKGRIKIYRA